MMRQSTTAARWALSGFAVTLVAMAGIQVGAQAIAGHNSNAPVNYAADRIELQDRQNRVVLSGNVDITQAGLRLQAARTQVNYSDAGSVSIQRITALLTGIESLPCLATVIAKLPPLMSFCTTSTICRCAASMIARMVCRL